jgi:hypothetical protein
VPGANWLCFFSKAGGHDNVTALVIDWIGLG